MKQRIITGICLIFIILPTLLFAQTPFLPFAIAIGSVIAIFELSRCIGMKKAYPFVVPLYALAASLPFLSRFMVHGSLSVTAEPEFAAKHMGQYGAILMIIILFYFFTVAVFSRGKYNLADVCVLFAVAFYVLAGRKCGTYTQWTITQP